MAIVLNNDIGEVVWVDCFGEVETILRDVSVNISKSSYLLTLQTP